MIRWRPRLTWNVFFGLFATRHGVFAQSLSATGIRKTGCQERERIEVRKEHRTAGVETHHVHGSQRNKQTCDEQKHYRLRCLGTY